MDWNEHFVVFLVRERLAEAQAYADRMARVPRRDGRRVRQRIGAALIRVGHWLVGDAPALRSAAQLRLA